MQKKNSYLFTKAIKHLSIHKSVMCSVVTTLRTTFEFDVGEVPSIKSFNWVRKLKDNDVMLLYNKILY